MTQMSTEALMKVYTLRDQEPQLTKTWVPKDPNFPEDIVGKGDKGEDLIRKETKAWGRIS